MEHDAMLFIRLWAGLVGFYQATGSSLPVAFLTRYLDALTNIGFPKQTTVFSKALSHVLSLMLAHVLGLKKWA
ncbi:unnamed protein product [Prunus armeniaca]